LVRLIELLGVQVIGVFYEKYVLVKVQGEFKIGLSYKKFELARVQGNWDSTVVLYLTIVGIIIEDSIIVEIVL